MQNQDWEMIEDCKRRAYRWFVIRQLIILVSYSLIVYLGFKNSLIVGLGITVIVGVIIFFALMANSDAYRTALYDCRIDPDFYK